MIPTEDSGPESGLYVLADSDGVSWRRVSVSASIPLKPLERRFFGLVQLRRVLDALLLVWLLELAQVVAVGVPVAAGVAADRGTLGAVAGLSVAELMVGCFAAEVFGRSLGRLREDRRADGQQRTSKNAQAIGLLGLGALLLVPTALVMILVTLAAVSAGQAAPSSEALALVGILPGATWLAELFALAAAALLPIGADRLVAPRSGRRMSQDRAVFLLTAYLGGALPVLGLALVVQPGGGFDSYRAILALALGGMLSALFTIAAILIYRGLVEDAARAALAALRQGALLDGSKGKI